MLTLLALFLLVADDGPPDETPLPNWHKVTLDAKFRSEGVAVLDVNGDGKLDIATGEHWYEAPDWTPHAMQPPVDHGDGLNNYSRVFACWADDFNGDGFPDLLVIDYPGKPCYWLENPGKSRKTPIGDEAWVRHTVWHSACNETPQYVDLLKTGKRVLVMGAQPDGGKEDGNAGEMAYFSPASDCNALWVKHAVSGPPVDGKGAPGTARFAHGLGVGDVNNDGRLDVICTGGWWEQPATPDAGTAWRFHPADLGPECADIFAVDLDGDGKADILSTSAHKFGVFAHSQRAGGEGGFVKSDLFPKLVSETHAAHLVDLDGDGTPDLVTGKRWWSHGKSEPGSSWPARVYCLKGKRTADGSLSFTPQLLDGDSGIGTQFAVIDVDGDGKLDVVTSNKKGVRVLFQK